LGYEEERERVRGGGKEIVENRKDGRAKGRESGRENSEWRRGGTDEVE